MKLLIFAFAMCAVASAQISTEYLPPVAPVYHAPAPVYHAPAPVYHAPAPIYHAPAPVYHAPAPVYHAPATTYELPEQEYLPPVNDIGEGSLGADGYRYKTAKRLRFRNRRH